MSESREPVVDRTLLRLIEEVLRAEDYEVVTETIGGVSLPIVLAENNYFMAAATAGATVSDLALAEPHLVNRLREVSPQAGPKRWDAYALLLTQQKATNDDFESSRLFELAYDTSSARRIVQAGVNPDRSAVRRAIVPFIEPPRLVVDDLVMDPLTQLRVELVQHGQSEELVGRAIDLYRSGGSVADAF